LKEQWGKIGADIEIKTYSLSELKKIIKERNEKAINNIIANLSFLRLYNYNTYGIYKK